MDSHSEPARERGLRRLVHWAGAVTVGLAALGFAAAADAVARARGAVLDTAPWAMLAISPAFFAISVALTRRFFPGAQGSGVPQVMTALRTPDASVADRVLSLRVAAGKVVLTLVGLAGGASIGREGPTIQIGAALMHAFGRAARLDDPDTRRALVLAGGAAGIAAAFNTPLAGIVFAIEELSRSFESRTSGVVFTSVLIAGAVSLALVGNYTYFGTASATLPTGRALVAVGVCGVLGGAAGGTFARLLVAVSRGLPGRAGWLVGRSPISTAAFCGLAVAAIGLATRGATYGTGYAQARALVEGHAALPVFFFAAKLAATVVSYASGIPGGIFAPSLAVGAGLGGILAGWFPGADAGALVVLGMVAYFAGVVQAPITATVIVMEMVDNQRVTLGLMASAFLAFGTSRLICGVPLYAALADRMEDALRARGAAPASEDAGLPEGESDRLRGGA